MKFSQSVVIAALLGSLSQSEVNAVAIQQAEAQMQGVNADVTALKSKKKHHKAKKHHKKSHSQVQTADDELSGAKEVPKPAAEAQSEASMVAGRVAANKEIM